MVYTALLQLTFSINQDNVAWTCNLNSANENKL